MAGEEPPYLAVGTDVSAKYKGAFCEAKVKKVTRSVKCKVTFKNNLGTVTVPDDQIKGTLRVNAQVEVRHPEKNQYFEAVINKLHDQSRYTVVFDDGDETTLRRTSLCLKSGRHFAESETLDQLPLTHPEHFGTPVMGSKGRKRRSLNRDDGSSDEETPPKKKEVKLREPDPDIGKVVCVEMGEKRKSKDNWFPALVVSPSAQESVKIARKEEYLVRSFKDGKYYCICKKEAREFTREIGAKVDNNTLKTAVEKAQSYSDRDELPPHWDRDVLFRKETTSDEGDSNEDTESDTSDDEPSEEKDRFVAQLYKFMDDRGTPINKAPTVSNRDLNLYKLFKVVQKLGGYNRVTNHMQWKIVYTKMGLPSYNSSSSHQIKQAYKKYLHSFEDFYRKLGCTMGTNTRAGRMRHRTGRMITRDRDREFRTSGSKKKQEAKQDNKSDSKVKKEDAEDDKSKEDDAEKKSDDEDEKKVKAKKLNKKAETEKGPKIKGRKKINRDEESEDKTQDSTDDDDTYSDVDINVGDKVRVKYGRGRHQKIYEAKVLELEIENGEKSFYVHYTGWNMRYDEWVNRQRIVENLSLKVRKGRSAGSPKTPTNKVPAKRGRPPIGSGKGSTSTPRKSGSGQSRSRSTRSDKNSLTDSPFVNGLEPQRRSRNKSGPTTTTEEAGYTESDETDEGSSPEIKKEKIESVKDVSDCEKEEEDSPEQEDSGNEDVRNEKSDEEIESNKKRRGRKRTKKRIEDVEEEDEEEEEEDNDVDGLKPVTDLEKDDSWSNEKENELASEEETVVVKEEPVEKVEEEEEKPLTEMQPKEEEKGSESDEELDLPKEPVVTEPEQDMKVVLDEQTTEEIDEIVKEDLNAMPKIKEVVVEKIADIKVELELADEFAEEETEIERDIVSEDALQITKADDITESTSSTLIMPKSPEKVKEDLVVEEEKVVAKPSETVEEVVGDFMDEGLSRVGEEERVNDVEVKMEPIPQDFILNEEECEVTKKEKESKKKLEKSDEVKRKSKDKDGKAKKSKEKKKMKKDEVSKKKENRKRKDEESSEAGEKKKKNRKNKQSDSAKKKSKKKLDKTSDEDSKKSSRKSGKRKKKKWSSGDELDNSKSRKTEKRQEAEKLEEVLSKKDENEDLVTRLLCREDVPLSPVPEVNPSEGPSTHYDVRPLLPLSFSSSTGSAASSTSCSLKDNPRFSHQKSSEPSTVLDNTPPTTPESQDSVLSILNESESSPDEKSNSFADMESYACQESVDFAKSEAAMVLGSMLSYDKNPVEIEVQPPKRSNNYEEDVMPAKKRKKNRRQSHSTSDLAKMRKGNRNGTSDSDETHSEQAVLFQPVTSSTSNDSSYIATETEVTTTIISPRSPRPSKFNFFVELDDCSDGSQRIAIIQEKLSELKKTYMALKAEVACIDRRRKKLRRKEKEASAVVSSASHLECS